MNKIFISILIIGSVTIAHLPLSSTAYAIGAEQAEKKKRKTQLVGPTVGNKVGKEFEAYPQADFLRECLKATQIVDVKSLIAKGLGGEKLGDAIRQERIELIKQFKSTQ